MYPFFCCSVVARNMFKSLLNYVCAHMYVRLCARCWWAPLGPFGDYQGLLPCLGGSAAVDCRSVLILSGEPVLWLWSVLAQLCSESVTALSVKPLEPCCLSAIAKLVCSEEPGDLFCHRYLIMIKHEWSFWEHFWQVAPLLKTLAAG